MKVSRTPVAYDRTSTYRLSSSRLGRDALAGDNREIMRHSDGSLHAALIEATGDLGQMSLYGFAREGGTLQRLAGPINSGNSAADSEPATDSNQNGTYVAYIESQQGVRAGYVVHIPDPFGDPSHFTVHGPLTPPSAEATNSFLQASRGYNSVAYSWRDKKSGEIYVGVSTDGQTFPPAKLLVRDHNVVNGPAVGIFGDHVFVVFQTADPAFAPRGASHRDGAYYLAFCESGDLGQSWSDAAPLIADVGDLPSAAAFTLTGDEELRRDEVWLSGAAPRTASLQVLMWVDPESPDKRLFALSPISSSPGSGGDSWAGAPTEVGVLTWKPYAVGGSWRHVIANRGLFQRTSGGKEYAGRAGAQFKYCALPGTAVRVIAYVEEPPRGSELESRVAVVVSTNMGDSFEYEATFSASQLGLDPDADLVISNSACTYADGNGDLWQDLLVGDARRPGEVYHAMLPVGINIQGLDRTVTW